ncbi:hypothetical protein PIB30_113656, partial [Stylosanthes scabra]|nr:hypothetical protein [Stylosanthes scabra]
NDALLMKNNNMRPTGSSPADFGHSFQGSAPETNVVQGGARGNFKRGRGNGRNKRSPNNGFKHQRELSFKGKGKFKHPQTKSHANPKQRPSG